jgi:hypothetical protein
VCGISSDSCSRTALLPQTRRINSSAKGTPKEPPLMITTPHRSSPLKYYYPEHTINLRIKLKNDVESAYLSKMTYRTKSKSRGSATRDGISDRNGSQVAIPYISKNYRVLYNLLLNSDFEKKRRKPITDNLTMKVFNAQGLSDLRKATIEDELLSSEETEFPIQFCLLSETHAKTQKEMLNWIENSRLKDKYFVIADSEETPVELKSKGTAIIYSANWKPHFAGAQKCPGTVTVASFQIADKLITIGAVYKPSHSTENKGLIEKTEKFLTSLIKQQRVLNQGSKQTFFTLAGDWNNELNPSMDRAYLGNSQIPRSTLTNCKFLQDAISGRFGVVLSDIWRLKHPALIEYTHASNIKQGTSEARLDYFLTCPNTNLHTEFVEHDRSQINGMHHKGITLSLKIPITRLSSRKRKKRRRPSWDTSKFNKPHFTTASNKARASLGRLLISYKYLSYTIQLVLLLTIITITAT